MLLQPSSKPLPWWGEASTFSWAGELPGMAPSFISFLYMLKNNSGNLDSVPTDPHHFPKLPLKEEGKTVPNGGGPTLTPDLGLESQSIRFQESPPSPRARLSQSPPKV